MKDGKERWHTPICDMDQMYFASVAPVVVKNHVIPAVSGDDLDIPGYIESHDPETGKLQWRWYAHPKPGEPEAEDLASVDAMMHGGGMTWVPSTYDPELNLLYFGTGNPQPVIAGKGREGRQPLHGIASSRSIRIPAKWSGISNHPRTTRTTGTRCKRRCCSTAKSTGKPRKLMAQASRNGYFFVLDRDERQEHRHHRIRQNQLGARASTPRASRFRIRPRCRRSDGALVSPNQGGAANWPPPSFSPDTGLFYVNATRCLQRVLHLSTTDDKPEGWGGNDRGGLVRGDAAGDRLQDRQNALEP